MIKHQWRFLSVTLLLVLGNVWGAVAQQTNTTTSYFFDWAYWRFNIEDNWEIVDNPDEDISFQTADSVAIPLMYVLDEELEKEGVSLNDPASLIVYRLKDLAIYEGHVYDEKNASTETVDDVELLVYRATATTDGEKYDAWQLVRTVERPFYSMFVVLVIFPVVDATVNEDDLESAKRMLANAETWHVRDDGTADLAERYRFNVPEGWHVRVNDNNALLLENETHSGIFDFVLADVFAEAKIEATDTKNVIPFVLNRLYPGADLTAPITDFTTVETTDAEVTRYDYAVTTDEGDFTGVLLLVNIGDGELVVLDVFPLEDNELDEDAVATLAEVLGTISVIEK